MLVGSSQLALTNSHILMAMTGCLLQLRGGRAVEASVDGQQVIGLGLAAMTDNVVVALTTDERSTGTTLMVDVIYIDSDGQRNELVPVTIFALEQEVVTERQYIIDRVDRTVLNGAAIIVRFAELFPQLRLGADAQKAIEALTGDEVVFPQLVRHLRALDEAARVPIGNKYSPAVSYSRESEATLRHGTYGPMRDFATPDGFPPERWSLHTKLTGGNGARMYYRVEKVEERTVVLIGYFGDHLPTVKHH